MAATYRAPQVIERERRLAAELVRRAGLTPPVDVRALVQARADITEEPIPARCDAVVVRLHRREQRPLVILQPTGNWQRQRFTLGHELGHLLLPWHLGTIACDVDTRDLLGAYTHRRAESEANRFAAELLVPDTWIRRIFTDTNELPAVANAIYRADVSAHVACLQLVRVLEPGWVFSILDESEHVDLSGRSPDTRVAAPTRGDRIPPSYDRFCDEHHLIGHGSRTVMWWHFGGPVPLSPQPPETRSSTEILRELVERHAGARSPSTLFNQINGAIGYAYGHVRDQNLSLDELVGWFRSRFAGRNLPDSLLEDELLDHYLQARARELSR